MKLYFKLAFWGVILCLALSVAFVAGIRQQEQSARHMDSAKLESNAVGSPTELGAQASPPTRFGRPEDVPISITKASIGADSTKSELEQELAESRIRLEVVEQQAYLANPYLKIWEDYRSAPRSWADKDASAKAARLFISGLSKSNDVPKNHPTAAVSDLSNLMMPLLIVKIDSTDPQFRDLLERTFHFYVKDYMRLLKAAADKETPLTLDQFISTVKDSTAAQNDAIETLRIDFGMSPEILQGMERMEMGRLLTGLVDLYLGVNTPKELGEAREAVRRAEILLRRKQTTGQ